MSAGVESVTEQDIEYLRHGDRSFGLRLFRPEGRAAVPAIIDVHGGCWTMSDRTTCYDRGRHLAGCGFAVAAVDFRHGDDGYPTSLVDINYAVRWIKAQAEKLGIDAGRVGLSGTSSGGHLAMLAAMRPDDPQFCALPLDGDAQVRCVAMSWPVINPLSRYRHALRSRAKAEPSAWAEHIPELQERYWHDEATMRTGNPVTMLESGESVVLPPAIWVQGRPDEPHDYLDPESGQDKNEPERFADLYRRAGGDINVAYIDHSLRAGPASFEPLAEFFHEQLNQGPATDTSAVHDDTRPRGIDKSPA